MRLGRGAAWQTECRKVLEPRIGSLASWGPRTPVIWGGGGSFPLGV